MTITISIARAAGTDAANKQMRAAGRTAWNEADYDLACDVMHALLNGGAA
jgi:hypothetical protein